MSMVQVRIKGTTPLLVHKFTDAAAMEATKATRASIKSSNKTPRDEAEVFLYKSIKDNKTLVFPGINVHRSIIDAGIFHKVGRNKVTTAKTSLVPSAVFMQEIELPIKPAKWEVDSRPVVIPATGGRVIRHRPRFDEWELSFTLEIDEDTFPEDFVRLLVDDAGKKIGLGDFRPARKGPFGRFVVTHWKKLPEAQCQRN